MPPAEENANIARHLPAMAAQQPDHAALKIPRGRSAGRIDYLTLSFAELDAEVSAWCARFSDAGLRPGDRTLVMVRQGLPLIASVFALFRIGAVPVVVDPGMGLRNFLGCVQRARPRALVGIPAARLISRIFPRAFASLQTRVAASSALTARLTRRASAPAPVARRDRGDLAAILFTSGSTGAPKGVCYEHGMFEAQVRLIRETYAIAPGEVDLPLLPVFALFNPALGMTTIVPEIDPRRPATVDPAKIVQAIRQEEVTNSFGSPTLWRKIAAHCVRTGISLPSLRRVLCAGATVPAELWRHAGAWLPNGQLHSPYGATEALPVASVSGTEMSALHGRGACVGRPVREMRLKIIRVEEQPLTTLADTRELDIGEVGEIIVAGPVVTTSYDGDAPATAAAKIGGPADAPPPVGDPARPSVWHRMGDCGYLDAAGRLWFCGRKVERVETEVGPLFTEPCEQVFRAHPSVSRCALIGLGPRGHQRPAIVVEPSPGSPRACQILAEELRALGRAATATADITRFYFRARFPVDVRHNAKIHRLALARWATNARAFETEPA